MDVTKLPKKVFSGYIKSAAHVQGIATDGEYMYYSFTTRLVKTDMEGNLIGTADGLTGHLGCIAYSDTDHCVYGSLECKNDGIGKGILANLGITEQNPDAFFLTRFDVSRITKPHMDAIGDGIMTMVKLTDVCEDYLYDDGNIKHRHGCSGIDGVTIVPDFMGARTIFVAYGIYGDVEREDNDDQVLIAFDHAALQNKFAPIRQNDNNEGVRADRKLFVHTGNTTFGIQNLEYDSHTDCLLAAVYCGKKPQFPNRHMYFIDLSKPVYEEDGKTRLTLAKRGLPHESGIWGSDFELGSTGMISLGDGYYYFSKSGSEKELGNYSSVTMYRIDGTGNFVPAE
ncbi:MAG: hypothetical protein IJ428_06355 [Clostridia bacterium]|nr:hypothetical protein [Clostridia bacterium]